VDAVTLYLVPLAIVGLSGWLMVRQSRQWRSEQAADLDAGEVRYHRNRHRRRMQSSAMLMLAGIAMYAGQLIGRDRPTLYVFFWCGLALLVMWIIVLALADIVSTRLHIARLMRRRTVEEARLRAELARVGGASEKGQAKTDEHTSQNNSSG
jgi:hypothetical protein